MYLGGVIVFEHSLRTHKRPQLRFARARCARTEPGVVCRPFLFRLHPAPPFFKSCDCTSETTFRVTNFFYRKQLTLKHFWLEEGRCRMKTKKKRSANNAR